MEKISIFIILGVMMLFIGRYISGHKGNGEVPEKTDNDFETCVPESIEITIRDMNGKKVSTKEVTYDQLKEGKDYMIGRAIPGTNNAKLWLAIETCNRVLSREHCVLFKEVENGVTRFGIDDNNSHNGLFVKKPGETGFTRVKQVEIKDGTIILIGEFMLTFKLINVRCLPSIDMDGDEDIKIYRPDTDKRRLETA